jgi:hypothetical protein
LKHQQTNFGTQLCLVLRNSSNTNTDDQRQEIKALERAEKRNRSLPAGTQTCRRPKSKDQKSVEYTVGTERLKEFSFPLCGGFLPVFVYIVASTVSFKNKK